MHKTKIVTSLLSSERVNAELINAVIGRLDFKPRDLIKITSNFMISRKNVSYRASRYKEIENKYIRYYLMLIHHRFSHKGICKNEFNDVLLYLEEQRMKNDEIKMLLIKQCSVEQLYKIIDSKLLLKESNYFKIARRGFELGNFDFYKKVSNKLLDTTIRKKIELLSRYYSDDGITIKEIELSFSNIDERYFKDYLKNVDSLTWLDKSPKNLLEARYLSVNNNPILKVIENHINTGEPFSFIRLSDGEAYAFSDCPNLCSRQENHWWGHVLNQELRKKIKSDFSGIFTRKIDILGMPTPYKFLHYVDYKNRGSIEPNIDLDAKVVNRLCYSLNKINTLLSEKYIDTDYVCEDQINNMIFTTDNVKRLISISKRVIVISGYKESYIKSITSNSDIVVVEIPTHNLLTSRDEIVANEKPLPFVYEEIRDWIANNVERGDTVLVSGGFIGKMFVSDAKNKGAIALDVGQAFKSNLK